MYKQYPNDYFVDISGFGRNLSRGAYIIFLSRGGAQQPPGPKTPLKTLDFTDSGGVWAP